MGWQSSSNTLLIISALTAGFSGLFVYTPAPGKNSLLASVAAVALTDPYGNQVLAGVTEYRVTSPFNALSLNPLNTSPPALTFFNSATDQTGTYTQQWALGGLINASGVYAMDMSTSQLAVAPPFWGISQATSVLQPVDPVALNAAETWHPMTLLNSWTNVGAPDVTAQYSMSNQNEVRLTGLVQHASISGNSVIATLPAAYVPVSQQNLELGLLGATNVFASSAFNPRVFVDTSGNVTAANLPAGTTKVGFLGRYSLNA